MNPSKTVLFCLLFTSLILAFPSAQAQTTRIYEVVHPIRAVAGNPDAIPVTATVFYNSTVPGDYLTVSIFDLTLGPSQVASGMATSAPDACTNNSVLLAQCVIKPTGTSGAERLEFKIGGSMAKTQPAPGPWDLNLTTDLQDAKGNVIPGSAASVSFQIVLTPTPLLFIKVPSSVTVSLDGTNQTAGIIDGAEINLGEHTLSVPQFAAATITTRLRFDQWSDGVTDATRTILARADVWLEAIYVTQHKLNLNSTLGVTSGSGWYDANSTAAFSVAGSVPMSGFAGVIGAKWTFTGWYENGKLVAGSPEGKISMSQAHTLTATWQADYSIPLVVVGAIVAILAALAYVVIRKKPRPAKRRHARSRR